MHQSRNFNVADMYFNVVCDNKIPGENSEIILTVSSPYMHLSFNTKLFSSYRDFLTNSVYYHSETVRLKDLTVTKQRKYVKENK